MVCFALFEIAKHPDIQETIYEETLSILGDEKDAYIGLKHMQDMFYLDRVLKEVLRLYPSAPFIERITEEEIVLGRHLI